MGGAGIDPPHPLFPTGRAGTRAGALSPLGLGVLGVSPDADVTVVATSHAELVVPMLRHVGQSGNTTVYEWRRGLRPLRVERPVQEAPEQPKEDTVGPGQAATSRGGRGRLCRPSGRVRLFVLRGSRGSVILLPADRLGRLHAGTDRGGRCCRCRRGSPE